MTDLSIDSLRFEAKRLQHAYIAREPWAVERVGQRPPRGDIETLRRADFLHIVAQENGFESWPKLKHADETTGLERASRQQRLKIALFQGKNGIVQDLLAETPDLADGFFGLQCALYDLASVRTALQSNPKLAVQKFGPRSAILHLAFSRWHKAHPELRDDMIAVAELLVANGADVNDGFAFQPGDTHLLSALYGAIGHANNMVLGQWLLDHGADPNDGESLYHATELGHLDGLRMLLKAGADPKGTNAMLRAMDFHDHDAVELLIAHGADVQEFSEAPVGGEEPFVISALHQAARRGCDARMVGILLDAGGDPKVRYKGADAYGFARVHGNKPLSDMIEARGVQTPLSREERLLARAAEGLDSPGEFIDPAKLPEAYKHIIREILHLPGRLDHVKQLVALGLPYDQPDDQGITPVQIAGWEGLPEVMGYFIKLRPDMGHINGYGGTLLSTILHGSENNPERAGRDYIACLEMALTEGVALPRRAISSTGRRDITDFLEQWARDKPGQVV